MSFFVFSSPSKIIPDFLNMFSEIYFKLFINGGRTQKKNSHWILTCTDCNHILYYEAFLSLSLDGKAKANLMPISEVFCCITF